MKIFNCLHPKVYINKEGKLCSSPCGKCDSCRQRFLYDKITKLTGDCSKYKYVAFITLTYNEQNVPKVYDFSEDGFLSTPHEDVTDPEMFTKIKVVGNEVNVLNYDDVTKFIKRYRNILAARQRGEKVCYYYSGEYGTRFRRPHYHMLFMFNDDGQAARLDEDLHKAWQYGFINWSYSKGQSPAYVAKYINSIGYLPSFYEYAEFRQKSCFSKCKALGFRQFSDQQIEEMFYTGTLQTCVRSSKKSEHVVYVPLWRSVQDFLYPKIKGFRKIDDSQRIELYKVYEQAFEWFVKDSRHFDNSKNVMQFKDFEWWFFQKVYECRSRLWYTLLQCGFFSDYDVNRQIHFSDCKDELKSLYYTSRRVCMNAVKFGVSIVNYVKKICDFYRKLDYSRLVAQMNFLSEYSVTHSLEEMVCFYTNFILLTKKQLKRIDYEKELNLISKYLGYVVYLWQIQSYDFTNHVDYNCLYSLSSRLVKDSMRRKHINSYNLQF